MTPVTTRPSLDDDRLILRAGSFDVGYITKPNLEKLIEASRGWGPRELVPFWEHVSPTLYEGSGAEVSEE